MRYISCKLDDLKKIVLPIGYEGENDHTRVQVDAGEVFKEYPAAVPSLKVHGPGGTIYPAEVTRDGKNVIWDIKASDCAADGSGEAQFTFTLNNVIVKSCIAKIKVYRSIVGGSTPPDPVQDWVDNAEEVLDDLAAMDNIAKTAEAGDVGKALSPKTVVDGVVTEWQYVEPGAGTEDYTDLENKPQIGGVTLSGDKSLHDLGIAAESAIPDVSGKANLSVVAPAFDQATANDAGSLVTYTDGVVYVLPEGHTAGTTWANTQKTATNIAEQQRLLLNDIQGKPEVKDSTKTGVDLDVSDEDGNVILRLANGHIKTKNFDSENANGVKDSTATGIDLDIADDDGYVVTRFKDGHIQTKNFDSSKVGDNANLNTTEKSSIVGAINEIAANTANSRPVVETFTKTGNYTDGTALELTIDKAFSKGDKLFIHVEDGSKFYEAGHRASYYEGNTAFLPSFKGSNGYVEHIVTADNTSIKVRFGGSEYGQNVDNITVYVYRINGEIKPKIVTVASDGSGMFNTIRGAIDSISDANSYIKPYEIWVYPGTYNVLADYSDEEIADVEVPYTQTSFVGPKLTDGMSIKGVGGTRDEIVLTATLDPGEWSSDVRGQVSTLNIQGSGNIENMTILAYNIRYCVHDDFRSPINQKTYRTLRNLKFGGSLTNTPKFSTYGAGMATPRDYIIEDCDFGYTIGIHGNTNFAFECQIVMRNCSGYAFVIGDYADEETDAIVNCQVDNCSFERIHINHHYPSISPHVRLYGVGNEKSMVSCDDEYIYEFGNILKIEPGFTAGTVVMHTANSDMFEETDNIDTYCGIVISADSKNSYVQKSGFINSNFIGLSGLSIGDYVTVDETTKKVVSGGTASNAIGVVVATETNGPAFIKMRK